MENSTQLGLNRTGIQTAPLAAPRMIEAAQKAPTTEVEIGVDMAEIRQRYIEEADRVGSVPLPATVKGVIQSGLAKLTGKNPEVLLDKLGERAAFERGGTRLYEALIVKCEAATDLGVVDLAVVRRFHDEEARHFRLVASAIERLGGDPTAQTPCADIAGVESIGVLQVMTDPRTDLAQCLNAQLTAEMVDEAGWELLVQLTRAMGQTELAESFAPALREEQIHLATIRDWHTQMTLARAI
jgi:ferritin-like protein